MRQAQLAHPNHFGLAMAAGYAQTNKQLDERLAYYRVAVALRHNNAAAYNNLGWALQEKKDLEGALVAYRESLRLEPRYAKTHNNLGWALADAGDIDAAAIEYRKALELDPNLPLAHNNLGVYHARKGDHYGAIDEFQIAIGIDPTLVLPHQNLSWSLQMLWKLDEAIAESRKALECDPDFHPIYLTLAMCYKKKGDEEQAIKFIREAIRLDPTNPNYRYRLGWLLRVQEHYEEALAELREAVRFNPKNGFYHGDVGWSHLYKGDMDRAVLEFREAEKFDSDPDYWRITATRTERMKELLPSLKEVISGKSDPKTPYDAAVMALCCGMPFQSRYACSARLYEKAFKEDPKLADDMVIQHRWYAACYAARAARGDGVDAPQDLAERARLRNMVYAWLCAELEAHKMKAASSSRQDRNLVLGMLAELMYESEIRELRGLKYLSKLPAEESKKWLAFWDEVRAVYDATLRANRLPKSK
jgi:tetratricopeptide (TPR) repeat protein